MNLFYLDENPKLCAKYHCDKHVVKMILEYGQLLSGSYKFNNLVYDDKVKIPDKYKNHKLILWLNENKSHYIYLYNLFVSLLDEYTIRYMKIHSYEKYKNVLKNTPTIYQNNNDWKDPPKVMPDYLCNIDLNVIEAYRLYYKLCKKTFAVWKNQETPYWWLSKKG